MRRNELDTSWRAENSSPMTASSRRRFLALTGGATAVALTGIGSAYAEEDDDLVDYTGEDVVEVAVGGPDGENVFEPEAIRIDPGTTVVWDWESGNHDLVPTDIPARSDWEGVPDRHEAPYEHLHTFVHPGEYHYVCSPHEDQGMVGRVVVTADYDAADYTGKDDVEIAVGGPDGEDVFDPGTIVIDSGTTVEWVWESGNHDIVPTEQPDGSKWEGVPDRHEPPYDHEWTFDVPGTYGYVCSPHEDRGMTGTIIVLDDRTGEDVVEVDVGGPDGENIFEPERIRVDPGTTVVWDWESGNHDLVPTDIPVRSDWEGVDERYEPPYEHMHTFVHPGEYHYVCSPHEDQGMIGSIVVTNEYAVDDYTGQETVTLEVGGPDGENVFDSDAIVIDSGTTVEWEWESGNHDIVPTEIPDDCGWEGVPDRHEPPYDHEWTFQVPGRYGYVCSPHEDQGMTGMIFVLDDRTGEPEVTLEVGGPDGENIFEPELVTIDRGTTVTWEWVSGNHNLVPVEIPDDCGWEGVEDRYEPPYDHEWTFQVPGEYHYVCTPHVGDGMVGTLVVTDEELDEPDEEEEMDEEDERMDEEEEEMVEEDEEADEEMADEPDDDETPGPGIVGALASIGGVSYLLKRRLDGEPEQ